MNKSTIQTLIDKVIGKKGLIRVPSWWMRKVLMQIADWVQEGDDANDKKIVKVKEEADGKISTLETNTNSKISTLETNINTLETNTNEKISTFEANTNSKISTIDDILFEIIDKAKLHSLKMFSVKGGGWVYVDEVSQIIPSDAKVIIPFVNTFSFKGSGGINNISSIGLSATDTSSLTTMFEMFFNCPSLTSLDLSGLDTSAVTNMGEMFYGCSSLTSLDLTGLDTSAVTNMFRMFDGCSKLTSLDLSSFDTSAVTNMSSMFYKCSGLTSLDVTGFDTSAVTDMGGMFSVCSSLTSLDLSSFDTSAVTSMNRMFYKSSSLTSLDLSGLDTSAVTEMASMFYQCSGLTSLILGPNFFKTPTVTSVDFSASTKWTNDTVVTSLVTNSYDRATAGLRTMTLKLSANTKASLTDEQKAAITAKGYTIA